MRRHKRLTRLRDALLRRGIHARSCFQTFLTGAIVFGCALATLLLTDAPPPFALLLLWGLVGLGMLLAVAGYLGLLIFRLTDFLSGDVNHDKH